MALLWAYAADEISMTKVTIGTRDYEVELKSDSINVDGHEFLVSIEKGEEFVTVLVGDVAYRVALPPEDERKSGMTVEVDHRPFVIEFETGLSIAKTTTNQSAPTTRGKKKTASAARKGAIVSELAGKILQVNFAEGDTIEAGEVILLLEAMKMENEIKASSSGKITELPVKEGMQVAEGDTLAIIE